MPEYRYFLSPVPETPAPESDDLFIVEVDSIADAEQKIEPFRSIPYSELAWPHVLVWKRGDGKCRGFESSRLESLMAFNNRHNQLMPLG